MSKIGEKNYSARFLLQFLWVLRENRLMKELQFQFTVSFLIPSENDFRMKDSFRLK